MYNLSKVILLLLGVCFSTVSSQAQTTILDQNLLSEASFDTFTAVSVSGAQAWTFNAMYGAVCSGYAAGQSYDNEDWLVSPVMNLEQTDHVKLSFSHARGNGSVMNVGASDGWYQAFATANYTGDPATTQWIALEGLNQNITAAWQYIFSGQLLIPEAAKSQYSRIAFRYLSGGGQSATWEIKNVKVTGESQTAMPTFKITNWNTEWLGCTTFGPSNEDLQLNNVVSAMLSIDADIYCIQEVSNSTANPSIARLVALLGPEQWGGSIAPNSTDDCTQRQGLIYKKSKVQLVSAAELSSGNAAQGNSYYYNMTSGRYPALYNVNLVAGNTLIPLALVNIHSKAEDGNAMSYTRRLGASEALKTILDAPFYSTKNVMVIGDFNDYLTGTTSNACQCTASPYQNFMDDPIHYAGITSNMIDVDTSWGTHPLIEHIIISDELMGNYVANSVAQEVTVVQNTANYFNTTSNHLPVSASFQFAVLGNSNFNTSTQALRIYPNPVKGSFTVTTPFNDSTVQIYDVTGRQVLSKKINQSCIDASSLPAGIYIIKSGNQSGKFVKE